MPGVPKKTPFNLIDRQTNFFNCSRPSVVPTNNFGLPRPATPALAGIGIASPLVSEAATVPPSALCMEKHHQYLGPAPTKTDQAPATLPDYAVVAVRPLINPASEEAAVL